MNSTWKCRAIDPLTMATSTPDSEGFRPVLKLKNHKKAKTTPSGAPRVKPEVETEICFIFQLKKTDANFSWHSKSNSS